MTNAFYTIIATDLQHVVGGADGPKEGRPIGGKQPSSTDRSGTARGGNSSGGGSGGGNQSHGIDFILRGGISWH